MTDEQQHLVLLHPVFRRKVEAILETMRHLGYNPKIHNSVRTVEQQRRLVQTGRSKTMRSKHLKQKDGWVWAVDIVDANHLWNARKDFWLTLGRLALLHGCEWGGLWGVRNRRELQRFLTAQYGRGEWKDVAHEWLAPIGWDPAHVQFKGK